MTVQPTPAPRPRAGLLQRAGPVGPPLVLLVVMWVLEAVDLLLANRLDAAGIRPRDTDGLLGVLLSPFLHDGFQHLVANSIPLLALGTLVATAGRAVFWRVTGTVIVLGGLGTWLIAPGNSITIGASGLVFGYLGYLLVAGIRTRHWLDLVVGVLVLLLYGGLLLAALPWAVADTVSWQAHLCGALAGGASAWWWAPRRSGSTP